MLFCGLEAIYSGESTLSGGEAIWDRFALTHRNAAASQPALGQEGVSVDGAAYPSSEDVENVFFLYGASKPVSTSSSSTPLVTSTKLLPKTVLPFPLHNFRALCMLLSLASRF